MWCTAFSRVALFTVNCPERVAKKEGGIRLYGRVVEEKGWERGEDEK